MQATSSLCIQVHLCKITMWAEYVCAYGQKAQQIYFILNRKRENPLVDTEKCRYSHELEYHGAPWENQYQSIHQKSNGHRFNTIFIIMPNSLQNFQQNLKVKKGTSEIIASIVISYTRVCTRPYAPHISLKSKIKYANDSLGCNKLPIVCAIALPKHQSIWMLLSDHSENKRKASY